MNNETTKEPAPPAPDYLPKSPTRGKGVRRLNRWPLILAGGLAGVLLLVVIYTLYQRGQPTMSTAASDDSKPVAAAKPTDTLLSTAPPEGIAPAATVPSAPSAPTLTAAPAGAPAGPPLNTPDWKQYEQARLQLAQQRRQEAMTALHAKTAVSLDTPASSPTSPLGPGGGQAGQLAGSSAGSPGGLMAAAMRSQKKADPNGQGEKNKWISAGNQLAKGDYLTNTRVPPLSAYEIKAGTIIPGVMISGVNSDLPGQIIGQVSANVYDSATGRYLLIPQGAKLIGTYDSRVTLGQRRVLIAWHRIIFPDASSINLDTMPGADQSGFAGFRDQVNNHYWRIFGNAFMLSLFAAGIQLSQPQQQTNMLTNQQTIAAAIGQQLGQLGMEMTRRNMDIQPTITIRPGYRFNVMVTKDMVLPRPWAAAQ